MAVLTGLFRRGGSFYIKIVLPDTHPLRQQYANGRLVQSLGACTHRDAVVRGTVRRAEVLGGAMASTATAAQPGHAPPARAMALAKSALPSSCANTLRGVFNRWVEAKQRSKDSIAACGRAVTLFEQVVGKDGLQALRRTQGDEFRAWLIKQPTSSKTARDRLNWVKVLLKYAAQDLELLPKSPWVGLDIASKAVTARQPWSNEQLGRLFAHEIWAKRALPRTPLAGGVAAYWLPLLALYSGARCSELAQLTVEDISVDAEIPLIRIADTGEGQQVKSKAGRRLIPVHSELVRLGFLDYAASLPPGSLWPQLRKREGKPGGYYSQYFGGLRRDLKLPHTVVFHSFRHNVRTALAHARIPEPTIDRLLGHESTGSTGARVYTHIPLEPLREAIEACRFPTSHLRRLDCGPT